MGQQLGIRRTYWGASQVDKGVSRRQDRPRRAAASRGSASSCPTAGPTWPTARATPGPATSPPSCSKLNGPVWLAFHHEPEGDGDIKQWTAMQARLAPLVRGRRRRTWPTRSCSPAGTSSSAPRSTASTSLWPKNTKIDLLGLDIYNKYGVVKDGKERPRRTDWQGDYFGRIERLGQDRRRRLGRRRDRLQRQGCRGGPAVAEPHVQCAEGQRRRGVHLLQHQPEQRHHLGA